MKQGQPKVVYRRLEVGQGAERRRRRRLIIGVGIATALVAAIALATRGDGDSTADDAKPPAADAHTRAGAQRASARMARELGSERMFSTSARHDLLRSILASEGREEEIRAYDAQYAPLTKRIGLDPAGKPPLGAQFISRATPAGTAVRSYTGSGATVAVWCNTLFGLTSQSARQEIPVEDGWLTMTMSMVWQDGQWRMADMKQKDGPEPRTAAAREFAAEPIR
ncbi:hypothetical protein OG547_35400 (plasmid) [Streptomyces longwoodensis]|uniref:hypothetical protein n=1 Tax=Streptomyces longwoodensis TaxID=68231 RepID=UPI002ED38183|nr:hypothetical protein OG547_35400 [Streptomyces longwoodensis]